MKNSKKIAANGNEFPNGMAHLVDYKTVLVNIKKLSKFMIAFSIICFFWSLYSEQSLATAACIIFGTVCAYFIAESESGIILINSSKSTMNNQANDDKADTKIFYPVSEWHEDDGDCLFFKLDVGEPPVVTSPLSSDWDQEYFTHWMHLPDELKLTAKYIDTCLQSGINTQMR